MGVRAEIFRQHFKYSCIPQQKACSLFSQVLFLLFRIPSEDLIDSVIVWRRASDYPEGSLGNRVTWAGSLEPSSLFGQF